MYIWPANMYIIIILPRFTSLLNFQIAGQSVHFASVFYMPWISLARKNDNQNISFLIAITKLKRLAQWNNKNLSS